VDTCVLHSIEIHFIFNPEKKARCVKGGGAGEREEGKKRRHHKQRILPVY
jgi:hypothetical protein